jgi:hypothetical protein
MKKYAMFVFNGDPMCFIHVLLNALDMNARQETVRVVIEGSATQLVPDLDKEDHPLHGLWEKVKAAGLVAGVCKACAGKTDSLDAAKAQGLAPLSEMSGHPSMARFRNEGYELITF